MAVLSSTIRFLKYEYVSFISRKISIFSTNLSNSVNDNSEKLKQRQKELMAKGLPRKRSIPKVRNVILVASGKGGVGKSTTAVNLALALSKFPVLSSVGILDADIYGPSIPMMLNVDEQPLVEDQKMVPLRQYGLQCMSMGFLVPKDSATVWRGPMVMGAIEKMIHGTLWGPLDYLIVDLPPGTGDIHLSISQTLHVTGVIIVSTPQKVALADAKKGVDMFEKVNNPVLGLVENMSAFICPNCQKSTSIFGQVGVSELAARLKVDVLGKVPLDPSIMASSDSGQPIVLTHPESAPSLVYKNMAELVANKVLKKS